MKLQSLCGIGFSVCCAHASQALPLWSELANNTAKTKMWYISSPSILNAIVGITSYYYVILKMVILHDAIETIQDGVFVFFFCFFLNKNLHLKKTGGLLF